MQHPASTLRLWTVKALFIVLLSSMSGSAAAQLHWGVKGGLQLSQMEFSANAFEKSNRVGFFFGPTLRISTPIIPLSIDVAAYYDQHNQRVSTETIKQQHIVVPAHLRVGASIADQLGLFLFAGPQFSFNIGHSVSEWLNEDHTTSQYVQQNTLLDFDLGVGFFIGSIEASVVYNIPLGRAGDFNWNNLSTQLGQQSWQHAKATTDVWRVAVAYYF